MILTNVPVFVNCMRGFINRQYGSLEGPCDLPVNLDQLRGRENGPDWEETNIALQQVMNDYAGSVRNDGLLRQGLSHLRRLKEKANTIMVAGNPHELGRCLEVLNMLDIGELVFLMARDRKETRGLHVRPDYPFTNPVLDQAHIIEMKDGRPVTQWRSYDG